MKRFISLLISLPLFLQVYGQDLFYYTFDKKKPLTVNQSSFSVAFHQDLAWKKLVKSSHPLIKAVHGNHSRATSRIIFELTEKSESSLEELLEKFLVNPALVKDVQWGFDINPRLTVWLTDELLFEPSDSWDEKKVGEILVKFPGAKVKQNEFGLFSIQVSKLIHSISLGNELVEAGFANWAQPDFMGGFTLFHTPSDPKYSKQFSFHNTGQSIDGSNGVSDIDINAEEAWDLTFGSSSIKVGILDEGAEDHEDLVDDMGNSRMLGGYSPAGTGTGASQLQYEGHGQAVAGLIGATHNSLGIAGVAPNTLMVPVYVEADPSTAVSFGVNGMAWLWQVADVDIINNSYGFKSCDPNLYPAFVSAIEDAQTMGRNGKGCVIIYASGENDNGVTCVNFPGNLPNVITVGAVDKSGNLPFYSPYGPELDVVVPSAGSSSNVRAIDREDTATNSADRIGLNIGNYLDFFGGTSSSCAIASGVAALVLASDPNLSYSDVEAIFTTTTSDLNDPGFDNESGHGLLKADAAVSLAIGGFPVEWLDFRGELVGDMANLTWITSSEQNNAYFEIQRSNGSAFTSLGTIQGAGTTQELNTYTFTDTRPLLGSNYYRIKQIDINGAFSYSPVIELNWSQVSQIVLSPVYPNPAQHEIRFTYALPRATDASYRIVDMNGRSIYQGKLEAGTTPKTISISTANWPSGIYTLVSKSTKGKINSQRFSILR